MVGALDALYLEFDTASGGLSFVGLQAGRILSVLASATHFKSASYLAIVTNGNADSARMASQSRSQTPPAIKRLLHEIRSQTQDPAPFLLSLGPVSDGKLLIWEAVLKGVPNTAYEGGLWKLSIEIPESYPLAPPNIKFDTPICHPNVQFKTGEICLDLLKTSWSPAYTIASTLDAIHQLLAYPAPDSPLNVDVASLLRDGDVVGAEALVRFYCEERRWSVR